MLHFTQLLPLLDHVEYRSGQQLAAHFNVTRATIHNCIARIDALGIQLDRIPGRGYRLCTPLDLLDKNDIVAKLTPQAGASLHAIECLQQVDSTNRIAADLATPPAEHFSVVIAEMQTAGKGRRGRAWCSPYAANIYASVVQSMQRPLHELCGLSPYLAICIVEKLHDLELPGLGVKWPNDIYCDGKKLAGLLIECTGELSGNGKVVIGFGVNVAMKNYHNIDIDQSWTDIYSNVEHWPYSRSFLAAQLISAVAGGVSAFEKNRHTDFIQRWARWDVMHNCDVDVVAEKNSRQGIARGVDPNGCLLLETERGVQRIAVGDVSLRGRA